MLFEEVVEVYPEYLPIMGKYINACGHKSLERQMENLFDNMKALRYLAVTMYYEDHDLCHEIIEKIYTTYFSNSIRRLRYNKKIPLLTHKEQMELIMIYFQPIILVDTSNVVITI